MNRLHMVSQITMMWATVITNKALMGFFPLMNKSNMRFQATFVFKGAITKLTIKLSALGFLFGF